jgi:adenine deaminase
MLDEMDVTRRAGKVIGGHYASPDLGLAFHAYAASGPEDDHEGTRLEDAIARVRQGMRAMLRYGSAWHDVAAQVTAITKLGLDSRHFILCTDDSHAGTLMSDGHMDRVVRHAIDQGLPLMLALQMATINTAEHFGVSRQVGMIAPGRWADILLVDDLKDFRVELVLVRGTVAAEHGRLLIDLSKVEYPTWVTQSVHLKQALTADDFRILTTLKAERVKCNVIGIIENQALTKHLQATLPIKEGEIQLTPGLAKVALHMLVVGTDERDMAIAANKLADIGGGQVVVKKGEIIGLVELVIGGLMSTEKAEMVAHKADTILEGFRNCGSTLNSPNMTMSLLALVVIPEMRISDKGLVDVTRFTFRPVIEGSAD